MNINHIINRTPISAPWSEGEKIPWNEPGFSSRMLKEHLSQSHDMASRRQEKIALQLDWIHGTVLKTKPSRILDLGCGPGFYSVGLAKRGHTCRGLDFSPASIEYGESLATREYVDVNFELVDIRHADFRTLNDLVMFIFGEFNVFKRGEAVDILGRAAGSLRPGGKILLEPSPFSSIKREPAGRVWSSFESGLFSEKPHLLLTESFWDEKERCATDRYFVLEAGNDKVTTIAASSQAYTDDEYRRLLEDAGFTDVTFLPSLTGEVDPTQKDLFVLTGVKA